jgi:hypothetical protein
MTKPHQHISHTYTEPFLHKARLTCNAYLIPCGNNHRAYCKHYATKPRYINERNLKKTSFSLYIQKHQERLIFLFSPWVRKGPKKRDEIFIYMKTFHSFVTFSKISKIFVKNADHNKHINILIFYFTQKKWFVWKKIWRAPSIETNAHNQSSRAYCFQ